MNDALRRELVAMRDEDLRVRAELERSGRLFGGYDPAMEVVHRRNAERLRQIVAESGWPARAIVGEAGAEAAWLIAQHAIGEPDFQRHCLTLLAQTAGAGDIPEWHHAYLLDRIRVSEGWPQVYGTQSYTLAEGGEAPYPIGDRAQVDQRRRRVGLGPLPPPQPRSTEGATAEQAAEHRRFELAMHAWARRVGWRPRILHLADAGVWSAAQDVEVYAPASLESEGFIHFSEPQQVLRVANARFRGRDDLVLLQVPVARLTAPLRYENLEGGDEPFPHVYGSIALDAVIRATPFPCRADGSFDHDQLAALY